MIKLNPIIPGHDRIRNIIFDFGNVICDIDVRLTEEKFKEFGPAKPSFEGSQENSANLFNQLVEHYESGRISSQEFRTAIRNHYVTPPTDEAIDEAWNALLLTIPDRRIRLLNEIKSYYRIFLLSNSNEIHYLHYLKDFQQKSGLQDFDALFEKAYFSFRVKITKPSPVIFEMVLKNHHLDPAETLFIDDTMKHISGALTTGITAYHLQSGMDVCSLFL